MDFYIKNEILVIDDIDTTETKKFLSHLAVVKAVKAVGKSIITLMAQLEEYQKKLWLKKKMVASADFWSLLIIFLLLCMRKSDRMTSSVRSG